MIVEEVRQDIQITLVKRAWRVVRDVNPRLRKGSASETLECSASGGGQGLVDWVSPGIASLNRYRTEGIAADGTARAGRIM